MVVCLPFQQEPCSSILLYRYNSLTKINSFLITIIVISVCPGYVSPHLIAVDGWSAVAQQVTSFSLLRKTRLVNTVDL